LRETLRRRVIGFVLLTLIGSAAFAQTVSGQQPSGTTEACSISPSHERAELSGTVLDPSGAAIGGATISLHCGSFLQQVHTVGDGTYSLSVSAGTYELQVEAPGFETFTQQVTLHPATGQKQTLDFSMKLGRAASIVSVTAPVGYVAASATSATKTDTPLIETPQSISVITLDQMTDRNVQTLNQAIEFTSGVGVQTYGTDTRFDWLNIRGFDQSTYGLFRDNSRWQSGQVEGQIDPYELQEVDVIKGPSSVLYGQNTPGGLVNLVTKRPEAETSNELEASFGSYNRRQVQGDFGGPIDQSAHWRYRLVGLYRDSDTQVNYVPDDRRLLSAGLTWVPSGSTTLTLLADYQHDLTGWSQFLPSQGTIAANPFGRIPTDFFTGEPGFDYFKRQQWSTGGLFEHRFGRAWTIRETTRYSKIAFHGDDAFGGGLLANMRSLSRFGYSDALALGLYTSDTQALAQFKTGTFEHSVLVGIDYSHANVLNYEGLGSAPPIDVFAPVYGARIGPLSLFLNNRQPSWQTGIYFQDHVKFARKFIATLSGREDWTKLKTYNLFNNSATTQSPQQFTGRAGITYLSDIGLAPYFSYSTSFLPTAGVNFFGAPYKPTTGKQYEGGLKYQPKGSDSFITASYFNIDENNVQTPDPANPLNTLQTGAIRSRGFEAEGVASILRGLNLHASYSYLDEKVTKTTDPTQLGKRPTLIPKQFAGLTMNYSVTRGELSGAGVGFGVRYVGTTAGDPQNTLILPGYTLFEASLRYDWRVIRFQVTATNLGDRIYVPICTSASYCNYGNRRDIIGSVIYRWQNWHHPF
jgi:iron complex outermembrane recepter protein